MRSVELLAPAKNLECGKAAIDHGADAVYIGASRFGARAAAGNRVDDIAELCRYAHCFGAKVYVTVNTIIYDQELNDTMCLINELQSVGVDAILVQDLGLLQKFPHSSSHHPVFHASTQTDNRTVEKVRWLRSSGFSRVVLARELSIEEISMIHHEVPDVELEVFVHGALCVSYSGVCYASQYCFGRSANRGECAQFCRMKFDLKDADGRVLQRQRHLLSLKDLCQIDRLEDLLRAGAVSLKIEGRLKDVSYVKNVVAAYSQRLNEVIARHPDEYQRASRGHCTYMFSPSLEKTFNRGYTHYFLDGRQTDVASFDTPKAIGEFVGTVKEVRKPWFTVAGTASFANGDGLCFINSDHDLEGFRVNRAEGNRLFPQRMPASLRPGMAVYRNSDVAFEKILAGKSAVRKIPVTMWLRDCDDGFELEVSDGQHTVVEQKVYERQQAQIPQRENIIRQLSKLGNTIYEVNAIEISESMADCFIPSSILAETRRKVVEKLLKLTLSDQQPEKVSVGKDKHQEQPALRWQPEYAQYPYLYNIANEAAKAFYDSHGLKSQEDAFELQRVNRHASVISPNHHKEILLMQCRHCIRYSLGFCVKRGGKKPLWREPLYLELADKRRFRLEFHCKECQMNIYSDEGQER